MNPVNRLHVQVPIEILAREDLTATAKLVWGYLRFRESPEAPAWPSLGEIAEAIGASRPTAQKAVRDLAAAGLVVIVAAGGGYGTTGKYRAALPTVKVLDSKCPTYHQETLPPASKNLDSKCPTYHQETLPPASKNLDSKCPTYGQDSLCNKEIESETPRERERAAAPSPIARVGQDKDGDGNDQDVVAEEVLRAAFPGGASESQRAALVNAVAEGRRLGATKADMLASLDDPALVTEFPKPWLRIEHAARRLCEQRKRAVASAVASKAATETPRTPDPPSPRLPALVEAVELGRAGRAKRTDGPEFPVIAADLGKGLCVNMPGEPPYGGPQWLRTEAEMSRWTFLPAATAPAEAVRP